MCGPNFKPFMSLVFPLNLTGSIPRHRQGSPESHWKGPYIILLTTPTTIKVNGVATWIHYTYARPADLFTLRYNYHSEGWDASRDRDNSLKLWSGTTGEHNHSVNLDRMGDGDQQQPPHPPWR